MTYKSPLIELFGKDVIIPWVQKNDSTQEIFVSIWIRNMVGHGAKGSLYLCGRL